MIPFIRRPLSRSDWSGWTNTMSPEISYCVETADCNGQNIIHQMCVGHFDCASNTCHAVFGELRDAAH